MRDLPARTLADLDAANIDVTATREIDADADQVFAALADAPSWPEWHLLTDAEWVTSAPFGVGSRRRAAIGPMKILEEFIAWDAGERIAFTFVGAEGMGTQALRGGVELVELRPGTVGRTVVTYRFAISVAGPDALLGPLAGPGTKLALTSALAKLEKRLVAARDNRDMSPG